MRLFYFFFLILFSTQNKVPQMIFGKGRVIYHNKALAVVIRSLFKNSHFRSSLNF